LTNHDCQFFHIFREGLEFGIEGRNIGSDFLEFILGVFVFIVQGSVIDVKLLVVGVGHCGDKKEIMGMVGLQKSVYE
jgi:hypothetical protein